MLDLSTLMIKHFGTDDPKKLKVIEKEDQDARNSIPDEEFVKIPFPYYAPNDSLPPIPTPEDVENSQTQEYILSDRAFCAVGHVCRVNTVYAVKFSRCDQLLQEAENLLFLQEHKVRAPKVYAVFAHQGADPLGLKKRNPPHKSLPMYYYMVMDLIDGVALDEDMWEDFALETRIKIYDKIGEQLQLLRSIPPPNPSYYGRINYQGYHPRTFGIGYRQQGLVGPFNTYKAFLEQIEPERELFASNFFDCLGDSLESGEPKLSHLDLKISNMMLVPSASNPSNQVEDYDLWLLDWEFLCWMPAWAEAAGVLKRLPYSDTEKRWLPQWRVSSGIKPFYYAQAYFYHECGRAFGYAT